MSLNESKGSDCGAGHSGAILGEGVKTWTEAAVFPGRSDAGVRRQFEGGELQDRSVIVWFRRDLRVADHPALQAASATGRPVIPVFVLGAGGSVRRPGAAATWWLHHALGDLRSSLERLGLPLILRRGHPAEILASLVREAGAGDVYWNDEFEPGAQQRDEVVTVAVRERGAGVRRFDGNLLFGPGTVRTGTGGLFKVFTPFWTALRRGPEPDRPLRAPEHACAPVEIPFSERLEDWRLLPVAPDWAGGLRDAWVPTEAAGLERLAEFYDDSLATYVERRDIPFEDGTSRISPYLAWGQISSRQAWHAARFRAQRSDGVLEARSWDYLRQIAWREFSWNLLQGNPDMASRPLNRRFERFPWIEDAASLRAWQRGMTGYPIVDAGMRQLWALGWMHNRVRMIVGSFLVKHLLTPWQRGEAWFWDTLVDADGANNAAGWQWIAGCGADAAPYFRIFNLVLQGEKFDPEGFYVRKWVPELAKLPRGWIHKPWELGAADLRDGGVELGRTYPVPIVSHKAARERALAALATLRA
jgi:deoxyribodipyrimidine photo-lyase